MSDQALKDAVGKWQHVIKQEKDPQKRKELIRKAAEEVNTELVKQTKPSQAKPGDRTVSSVFRKNKEVPIEKIIRLRKAEPTVVQFQKRGDMVHILDALMKSKYPDYNVYKSKNDLTQMLVDEYRDEQDAVLEKVATGGSAVTGFGDEFVPTGLSADYFDLERFETKLTKLLPPEVNQPTNPWPIPRIASDSTAFLAEESTDTNAADYESSRVGTAQATLTLRKMAVAVFTPDELIEDSIVPIIETIRENMQIALNEGLESAIINGDTSATHMDGNKYPDGHYVEKAFVGLRKWSSNASNFTGVAASTAITESEIRTIRKAMGIYGADTSKLAIVTGAAGYFHMYNGFSTFQTMDKYGDLAVNRTGELARFDNIPIFMSPKYPEDLAATGVWAASSAYTSITLFNHRNFLLGKHAKFPQARLEVERQILKGREVIVLSVRKSFSGVRASTAKICGTLYGMTV